MNLGAILHLNGKLQEAEANYLRALQLKPDDTITQSNLRKLWNIMEKQGLRTASPWAEPSELPCAHQTWDKAAHALIQEEDLFSEARTIPQAPNDSVSSSYTSGHEYCSRFGRLHMFFGLKDFLH